MRFRIGALAVAVSAAALLTSCSSADGGRSLAAGDAFPRTTVVADSSSPGSNNSLTSTRGTKTSLASLDLDDAVADLEDEYDVEIGVALYTPKTQYFAGSLKTLPAWSTIKVPLALVAEAHCDINERSRENLIRASLEWSDNDAAWRLFKCEGISEEQARSKIENVIARATPGVEVPDAYGMTDWTFKDQAKFGYYLSRLPKNVLTVDAMYEVVEEQRWGLGEIDDAAFKGGWSDDDDGSFHSRQFGFVELDGTVYGIALGARSESGSEEDSQDALSDLATELGTVG